MGGDVSSICETRGSIKLNKPEKITNADEIKTLDDLAQLIELYQALSNIDFKGMLPDSVIKPLTDKAGQCHKAESVCYKSAIELFVDALEKAKFNENDKAAVEKVLVLVRPKRDLLLKILSTTSPTVSVKIRDRYYVIEKATQSGFLHKRAIAALKSVIVELGQSLSATASNKLKINEEGWMDRVKIEDVDGTIKLYCEAGYEEPKVPTTPLNITPPVGPKTIKTIPTTQPVKPEEEFKPVFKYSLRLGGGYGDRVLGNNMYMLSDEDRGVLVQGGASGQLLIAPKLGLQLDYNAAVAYDAVTHEDREPKNDDLVSNNDYGRLTFFGRPHDNFDFAAKIGWRYYRSDYPTVLNPDQNVLVEGFRLNWRPVTNLSLNLDHGLTAGWTSSTYGAEKGDFKVASGYGAPGVSYEFGPVIPFLGAILGYEAGKPVYGGYAGAGLKNIKGHEADIKGQYLYGRGESENGELRVTGRYMYGMEGFGIGALTAYAWDTDKRHQVIGGIFSDIVLANFWDQNLSLVPFFNIGYEQQEKDSKKDNTVNLNGGLFLRFGDLRPSEMPAVRPYSTKPLAEEK